MTRIRIYEARNSVEAHMALAALLAAGVDARAEANHLSGAWIDSLPVALWVNKDQLPLARQVLVDFEQEGAQTAPKDSAWACPSCGERNGRAFEACWKCSTAKES